MNKYVVELTLYIDPIEAHNPSCAEEIVNKYVDLLAQTKGNLTWEICDWTIQDYAEILVP